MVDCILAFSGGNKGDLEISVYPPRLRQKYEGSFYVKRFGNVRVEGAHDTAVGVEYRKARQSKKQLES